MSSGVLPSQHDLQGIASISDLLGLLHVPDPLWASFISQVGDPGPHIRLLAALPRAALVQGAVQGSTTDGGSFSAIQAAQVGLVWRTSRKLVHLWAGLPEDDFKDLDPWEPRGGQAEGTDTSGNQWARATTGTPVATPLKERVLKMSSLVDQTDDSELNLASREQVDGWLAAYVSIGECPIRGGGTVGVSVSSSSSKGVRAQGCALR
eukprot:s307_g19.t1